MSNRGNELSWAIGYTDRNRMRSDGPLYVIMARDDAAGLIALGSRALIAAAFERPLAVLWRLHGVVWASSDAAAPRGDRDLSAWLAAQEFPDALAYARMALAAAAATEYACGDSLRAWRVVPAAHVQASGLAGFVAAAVAAGAEVAWL